MRSDSWPLALTMTTGALRSSESLLSIRSTSLPATSGSIKSSSTRSGIRARALASPPAPVFAVSVSKPAARRLYSTSPARSCSSSMIRMRAMTLLPKGMDAWRPVADSCRRTRAGSRPASTWGRVGAATE